jgi:hypothetical protein
MVSFPEFSAVMRNLDPSLSTHNLSKVFREVGIQHMDQRFKHSKIDEKERRDIAPSLSTHKLSKVFREVKHAV